MIISSGLFDSGVLQRTAEDVSDALITGKCKASGPVLARVTRDGAVLPGFDGAAIGQAEKGKFTARLAGLPVGGPYAVELQAESERVTVQDVLVGDLWILGGQSNMQGCGITADGEQPHPLVRAWYMDDRWAVARDPIHNMWATVDQVHFDLCGGVRPEKNTVRSAGPGVAFGVEMQRLTGVPQGVIACAHGGTSMAQWDPRLKGHSLYGAALRRVKKLGGRVAGLAWYQGCSDANVEAAPVYTQAMQALVRAFRRDLDAPALPVAMVQIATVYGQSLFTHWNAIQEQQRRLPKFIKHLTVVPAIDLTLDDLIHISGKDQTRLGRRLAAAIQRLRAGDDLPAIMPKKVKVTYNKTRATADIVVTFDHVVGELHAPGRPWGFTLAGEPEDVIYRVELNGNQAILRTTLQVTEIGDRVLYYGQGNSPYCNITDAADRALPVFGPLPLGEPRALTPYVREPRVSAPLPLQGSIAGLAYPSPLPKLQAREFPTTFCDLHLDAGRAQAPQVQYLACRLRCAEAMKLALLLGYDGPVKAWADGKEVFCDPKGINPAIPDESSTPLDLAAGEHDVLIALDLNSDRAWGIYLRFERKDVTKGQVLKGNFILPEILG
ncbi:MAG: sialate O-acetylesterase [Armatimonadota bacterium]